MKTIKQISIFLENKSGRLAKVTETLEKANINIHALSLADTTDFGILRLIVDDTEKAKEQLKSSGFTVGITNVIGVEMVHKPGGLHSILSLFEGMTINIEYMYAFMHHDAKSAILVFRCQDEAAAIEVLEKNNIKILNEEKIRRV